MTKPQTCRIVLTTKVADKAVRIAEAQTGLKLSRSTAASYLLQQVKEEAN